MCNSIGSEMHFTSYVFFFQIELLKKTIKKFYGEDPINSKSIARIVNKKQFERLRNLLQAPLVSASIVHGGSLDEEKL